MTLRRNFATKASKQLNRVKEPDRQKIVEAIAAIGGYSQAEEQVRGSRVIHKIKVPGKHAYYRVFYKLLVNGAKVLRIEERGPATYHRINPKREQSPHIHN